jgi:hypothetical protein
MKLRSTGKIITDEWEQYDGLSKRKIIRKSYPCRVNITVFAANPIAVAPSPEGSQPDAQAARAGDDSSPRMESPPSSQDQTTETSEPPSKSEPKKIRECPRE